MTEIVFPEETTQVLEFPPEYINTQCPYSVRPRRWWASPIDKVELRLKALRLANSLALLLKTFKRLLRLKA